jgi:hypothetical protein
LGLGRSQGREAVTLGRICSQQPNEQLKPTGPATSPVFRDSTSLLAAAAV